jgi:hypothetical protein
MAKLGAEPPISEPPISEPPTVQIAMRLDPTGARVVVLSGELRRVLKATGLSNVFSIESS